MPISSLGSPAQRIGTIKGTIIKHAIPQISLGTVGVNDEFKRNSGNTVIYRQFLPEGATSAQPNRFFQDANGDRSATLVQTFETSEGITAQARTINTRDVTATVKQFSILTGYTDQAADLHEDDLPAAYLKYVGETKGLVNEQNLFGVLKACSNKYYGGTGTSRGTVNGTLTLTLLQRVARGLMSNHAVTIKQMQRLGKAGDYGTAPVGACYPVWIHTDLEADVRRLENFTPVEEYGDPSIAVPNELGKCESFRFIKSPELVEVQNAGAAVAGSVPALKSTTGTYADVYQVIVGSQDAWGHIGIDKDKMDAVVITPKAGRDSADPLGQRGAVGCKWYYHAVVLNPMQMAVIEVSSRALTD